MLELLKISEAMSIALHTCVWLANDSGKFQSARRISAELGFSLHHSAKVVQQLVKAGLLETERGPAGGARLARPSAKITLFEIYVATDGLPVQSGCLLKNAVCCGNTCVLGRRLSKENAQRITFFKKQTIRSIARSLKRTADKL